MSQLAIPGFSYVFRRTCTPEFKHLVEDEADAGASMSQEFESLESELRAAESREAVLKEAIRKTEERQRVEAEQMREAPPGAVRCILCVRVCLHPICPGIAYC